MVKKKFGWRREDSSAAFKAPSRDKPDGKVKSAPAADEPTDASEPADWFDLRNAADLRKEARRAPKAQQWGRRFSLGAA